MKSTVAQQEIDRSTPEKHGAEFGRVSAIIPVHNRPVLLREAVFSVLAQSHPLIEAVIVNDGSTDETRSVADTLAQSHPDKVRVLHISNCGPGLAREAGRKTAKGEFIQYLDSDDLLLPRKFELQVAALRKHPECGVAYGMTHFRDPSTEEPIKPWKRTGEKIESMFPALLYSRWWGTSTPLYRQSLLDAAGPWSALRNEEDWEYDCRIAALGVRLAFVPEFVSEEREHSGVRLSRGGTLSPDKLRDRATAHALILGHAQRAGLTDCVEMRHFARELFLLARQCGAAGLSGESETLFNLARSASGKARADGLDFKIYRLAASIFGWSLTGRLACASDRLRQ